MKIEFIIEDADNGMTVLDEDNVLTVIENTHTENVNGLDNIYSCLGEIFHGLILQAMNTLPSNRVKMEINIKEDGK